MHYPQKRAGSDQLTKMEILLAEYFENDRMLESGLPAVLLY